MALSREASTENWGGRERWLRLALIAIAVAALAAVVWFTVDVFLLIFSGILLAIFVRGLSDWLAGHTPLGAGLALALVVLGLVVVLGGSFWVAGSQVATQIDEVVAGLPQAIDRIEQHLAATPWGPLVLERLPSLDLGGAQSIALTTLGEVVAVVGGVITYTLLILFFGLFLAIKPELYVRGALHLLPRQQRARAHQVALAIGEALRRYLLAKALSMLVSGIIVTLGLWLLGLPLPVPLGMLTALLTFIPVVGPLVALVPALLLALLQGPFVALAVVVLYLGVQVADNYLLKPLVYQQALSFPPALTLGAQVFMGVLVGGFGVVLASPLAVTIFVLVRMLYVEDALHDPVTQTAAEAPGEVGSRAT